MSHPFHNYYTEDQVSLTAWEVEEGDHVFCIDNTNIVQIDSYITDGVFATEDDWENYKTTISMNNIPSGVIAYWEKELRNTKYVFARQVGPDSYFELDADDLEFDFDYEFSSGGVEEQIEITFTTKIKSKQYSNYSF